YTNVVTVRGHDDEGDSTSTTATHTVTGTNVAPHIAVVKDGPATIAEGGASATYTLTITNNSVSTDPVTVTAISDDKLGNLLSTHKAHTGVNVLSLSSRASFPSRVTPFPYTTLFRSYTNVVTVRGHDDEGDSTTTTATHTVTGTDVAPHIAVVKDGP